MGKNVHLQYDGDETLISTTADGARLKVLPGTDFEVDPVTAAILREASPDIHDFSEKGAIRTARQDTPTSAPSSTDSSKPDA